MDRVFITYCLLILFCSVTNNDSFAVDEVSEGVQSPSSKYSKREVSGLRSPIGQFFAGTQIDRYESVKHGDLTDSSKLTTPSPCPHGALFCESADDYPKELIKDILKKSPVQLLGRQHVGETSKLRQRRAFGPLSRDGNFSVSIELCSTIAKIVFPNKAKSKEGVYEFVVNDEVYKQGIRVETCANNGGQCDLPGAFLSSEYQYTCVLKYNIRQLVVLNQNSSSDTQAMVNKPFEFPSCCSCVAMRKNFEETRIGGDQNTTPANTTTPPTTAKPVEAESMS